MPAPDNPNERSGDKVRKPRLLSRRRRWLFRLAAMGLSLVPLLVLEFVLRLCGVGHDTRLIVRDRAAAPNVFRFNSAADRAYYGVEDLWGPDPRPFEIPKPAGTYRIVVVGGSTVAGFPYPFELAMPKQLEVVLGAQMPDRKFEVLNAGMTAIMSWSEVDIVRQAIACQPDLIVVHSGQNEFYGPGGSASNFSSFTPRLYGLTQFLKRQRCFQLLFSTMHRPRKTHLVEVLPADIAIPLDGRVFRESRQRFQANLTRMTDIAVKARIPILLTTVPSNLRDFAPLQPSEKDGTVRRLKEAETLMSYREYGPVLAVLAEARRADPTDPLLAYRQGQCLEMLGRKEEAAQLYTLAADLDGCRFRAATSFLAVAGKVAAGRPELVHFCDVAAELRSRSQLPAPGNDFFLEHVHYNLEGAWQVASILGRCILEDVLGASWQPQRHPDAPSRDELLGVAPLDRLAADSVILIGLDAWPFNLSGARGQEANLVKARVAAGYQALEPTDRRLFAGLSMDAMHQHLWLAMGDAWLAAGHADRALGAFQRHIHRRPWDPAGYAGAASALKARGMSQEAEEILNRARQDTRDRARSRAG